MPALSIVIPAYNNGAYLRETLDSILTQDYADFEVVISDHASVDDTRAIAASSGDARVRVIDCAAGGGAGRNWRYVSDHATGEFVKLVCGDDLLLPGALAAQVAALREHPGASVVASRRQIVDARGASIIAARGIEGAAGPRTAGEVLRTTVRSGGNIFGEPGSVTMRREAFEAGGGWDSREKYLIDLSGYVAALRHGDFIGLDAVHAAFRLSATQWSARLVRYQHEQTRDFYRRLQFEFPQAISPADVRYGSARAFALAHARRAVYRTLKHRLGGDDITRTT
ncbi:glycosyltransferase family 2 protein [Micrococcales bacterium 31B]|nr:glycosyltransferase family 2 protein [Micrococcales bacterium 31B]